MAPVPISSACASQVEALAVAVGQRDGWRSVPFVADPSTGAAELAVPETVQVSFGIDDSAR
jgi:hypothetical protein